MKKILFRLLGMLVLGRNKRIDVFRIIADLLDAGFSLEAALDVTARVAREQGHDLRAWILNRWRRALLADRCAEEISQWVPPLEAMIIRAYGRIEADFLFAAAARISELRGRQADAVRKATAMPLFLAAGLVVLLWAAGGHFIPVLESVVPLEHWSQTATLFRTVSTWLYGEPWLFGAISLGTISILSVITVVWTGPGRTLLDRIAPFSLYRTLSGSAFLFAALEFLRAGVDLNDRTFNELRHAASPYARHRIGAIQGLMSRGAGLGQSMLLAGHGFPDPSLVPVVAALDGSPGWERKLAKFVDRWVERSEDLLKTRAAVLNAVLLLVVTAVMAAGIDAMFSILEQTARL